MEQGVKRIGGDCGIGASVVEAAVILQALYVLASTRRAVNAQTAKTKTDSDSGVVAQTTES